LHGNSSSGLTFIEIAEQTHDHIQIIAPDLNGCGQSARLDSYTLAIVGRAIGDFIRGIGIRNVILWGHSLGGHLLPHITPMDFVIAGVILAGTPPLESPESFSPNSQHPQPFTPSPTDMDLIPLLSRIEQFTFDEATRFVSHTGVTGQLLDIMIQEAISTDGRFRNGCLGTLTDSNQVEWLRLFDQIVIFQAELDGVINIDYLNSVTKELRLFENRIHIIEGARHMCPVTHPQYCISIIRKAFNI
jgi:pimeloyl-ACP methyl ester carboxylesterase